MRADPRASCAIATRVAPTRSRPPAPHRTTQRKRRRQAVVEWGSCGRCERGYVDRRQRIPKIDQLGKKVRRQPHARTRRKRTASIESSSNTAQKKPVREREPTNTRGRGGSREARVRKESPVSVRITAGFERGRCAHLRRCYRKWPFASHRAVDVQHENVEKERVSSSNENSMSAV